VVYNFVADIILQSIFIL